MFKELYNTIIRKQHPNLKMGRVEKTFNWRRHMNSTLKGIQHYSLGKYKLNPQGDTTIYPLEGYS